MFIAILRCGTVLAYEARDLLPASDERVPCRRHGYCGVRAVGRSRPAGRSRAAGSAAQALPRARPRAQHELEEWLRDRPATTVHALRRERFTLRMVAAAERKGLVTVDLEAGRVWRRRRSGDPDGAPRLPAEPPPHHPSSTSAGELMRALELTAFEGPDALRLAEVPEPRSDADGIVVDVRAIGINYPDLLMTQGSYQVKPPVPFVPGSEIAGVVSDAPEGSGWTVGDRVAAFVWAGGYAERVYVPRGAVFPLPDDMDFRTGAATIINYHTVHFALSRRGALRSGESLLVLGAAGGIGSAAVQVGKGLGAHVIGGVATEAQVEAAREAGADEVLVLTEGFSGAVRERTGGRGVDVVLDPLGDWLFGEALRALAPEGRILVVGFAAGAIPELKVNRLLLKNVSAVGVAWGAFLDIDTGLMVRASREIADLYSAGTLRPLVGQEFAFEGIPDALHHLSRGEIRGKAVVLLDHPAR